MAEIEEYMNELVKDSINAFSDGYTREIREVKALGERIGYGNMMTIASALWRIQLEDEWGITTGAFIPTIKSFMLKKEGERAEKLQKHHAESFRERLK